MLGTDHLSDHEFPQVLENFISNNFEPDAKITNLAGRKCGGTIPTIRVGPEQHLVTS